MQDYYSEDRSHDIILGEDEDYSVQTYARIVDTKSWSNVYEGVFTKVADGTFWRGTWEVGATESQEIDLGFALVQVYPKEVVTTIYVTEGPLG